MEILKERDMKLLSRKRVTIMMDSEGSTPSRQELIQKVASHFKVKENLVVIKHIYAQFGNSKTKLIVHIYSDEKKMKLFEHANLLKKHEKKTEEKAEETPAEPKTEEQPKESAEDKKEEKPAEEPKAEEKDEEKPQDEDKPEEEKPEGKKETKKDKKEDKS